MKRKVDGLEKQALIKENVVELENKVLKLEEFAEEKESKIIESENCKKDTAKREAVKNDSIAILEKRMKEVETKFEEIKSNEEKKIKVLEKINDKNQKRI